LTFVINFLKYVISHPDDIKSDPWLMFKGMTHCLLSTEDGSKWAETFRRNIYV